MTDETVRRCKHCRAELHVRKQYGGGPRKLALGCLFLVFGATLMLLSPPRPLLAVPATLLLALGLFMVLRRDELLVCSACQAASTENCPWLQQREVAATQVSL